jgi:hypothetical protein
MGYVFSVGGNDEMQVLTGGRELFEHLSFGEASQRSIDYVQRELDRAERVLSDLGRSGWETARETFDRFTGENAMRRAREISRRIGWMYQKDVIRPLSELKELQAAQPVMQRWIMANPAVRALHLRQECNGYSRTYVDIDPGKIGDDHYDYRRVMNGIVQTDDDTKPFYTIYVGDELLEGDRELDIGEKVDIMSSWRFVQAIIAEGTDDPTSIHGDMLD